MIRTFMNKTYTLIAVACMAVCCTARVEVEHTDSDASLNLTFPQMMDTRATVAADEGEKHVGSLYLAVFDAAGKLEKSHECTADEIAGMGTDGLTMTVKRGTKTVWAVANVDASKFANVRSLAEFKSVQVSLADASGLDDFAMKGSVENVNVTPSSPANASIVLSRFACRLVLTKVTNSLPESYGALQVKSIYLANVVCNDNIAQSASPSAWCNRLGHGGMQLKPETVVGNGSAVAENASFTFSTVAASVAAGQSKTLAGKQVYGFRNASETDPVERSSGFPSGGCCSVLYVVATVGGVDYWYPIAVKGLASNNNYNIELTITMPGQRPGDDDFGSLIDKGGIKALISVSDWTGGSTYTEEI